MVYSKTKGDGRGIPGNLEYFNNLYRHHYGDLVRFADAMLFDYEEAKDVVQEVFCYMWDNREKIQITSTIKTYLFTSVKHGALNRIKHLNIVDKHSDRVREAWWFSMNIDPEEDLVNLKRIHEISENFPGQMKNVFKLRTEEDLKYEEIAERLQISINSVKTHLRRAFSIIRRSLLFIAIMALGA